MKQVSTLALGAAAAVQPVFERMGWTWATAANGIPTVDEIAATIQRLVNDAWAAYDRGDADEGYSIATGRLCVTVQWYSDEDVKVEVFLSLGEDG